MGSPFSALAFHRAVGFFAFLALRFHRRHAFIGLWTGLISAYGKWVLSLAMTCVLAFVFAMGQPFAGPSRPQITWC